jgi:hypothetical protein
MNSNIISLLTPYDISSPKVRLGPNCDGGYIISEIALKECSFLFTYGVADDIRYEEAFSNNYNKPAYLFDHTINSSPWEKGLLKYTPEGLGFEDKCKDFLEHYNQFQLEGDALLKIDIEGNEYSYFENTDLSQISKITSGLLLEIHWINDPTVTPRFINLMNNLNEYFILTHTHGNNYGSTWNYESYVLPNVLELSFVNKKHISDFKKDENKYPIPELDYPNNVLTPDIELSFI